MHLIDFVPLLYLDTHCFKVLSHSGTTSSLIISAHEDKKIRFFDLNSGKCVYQIVAHQDACTDLSIDPSALFMLSSSNYLFLLTIYMI